MPRGRAPRGDKLALMTRALVLGRHETARARARGAFVSPLRVALCTSALCASALAACAAEAPDAAERLPTPQESSPEPAPSEEGSDLDGSNAGLDPSPELDPDAVAPLGSAGSSGAAAGSGAPPTGEAGAPAVDPAPEAPVGEVDPAELPPLRVWLAGDSTVANGNTPCPRGWGRAIGELFDERVTVENAARGGRSVHTWLYEVQDVFDDETGECALTRDERGEPLLQPHWQRMLDELAPGDYLFIQFGINDGDPRCNRHVGLEAFQSAYAMMAAAARERGAQPVFVTPVSSIACAGATARGSRGEFVPATLELGRAEGVPVIDLHERSVALYQALGFCPVPGGDVGAATTGPVGDFFCDDHTHFSDQGAREIARVVAQALREQELGLAAYLK